jgi:hypothetical protein
MKELISVIRPFSEEGPATAFPQGEVESSWLLGVRSATKVKPIE